MEFITGKFHCVKFIDLWFDAWWLLSAWVFCFCFRFGVFCFLFWWWCWFWFFLNILNQRLYFLSYLTVEGQNMTAFSLSSAIALKIPNYFLSSWSLKIWRRQTLWFDDTILALDWDFLPVHFFSGSENTLPSLRHWSPSKTQPPRPWPYFYLFFSLSSQCTWFM